jgi:hypothetical protein
MSNRRDLKKLINASMNALYGDCFLYVAFVNKDNIKRAEELVDKIAATQAELLSRANASEGKEVKNRVKAYYKKLREDLKNSVNELGQEIQQLG